MKNIATLLEQTEYLLLKHRESAALCRAELEALLKLTAEKRDETFDVEDKETLTAVHEALSTQAEAIGETIEDDVKYLEEQVAAMREVAVMPEGQRKQELADLLLVEEGDLRPMDEFKKEIDADAEESRRSFIDMVTDIKQALNEGLLEELEAMLEAMDEEDEDEEGCCGDDEEGCCDSEEDEECCDSENVAEGAESECCSKDGKADNWLESLASGKVYDVEEAELEEMPTSKIPTPGTKKQCCRGGDFDCRGNCVCQA